MVHWVARHSDAFRLISFQPIAQVGRTEEGYGGGVDVDALWNEVAAGLGVSGGAVRMRELGVWFGHEACNRMVNGVVVRHPGDQVRFHALRDAREEVDVRVVDGFLSRFGGISFRLDSAWERRTRLAAVTLAAPGFILGNLLPYAAHWLRRIGEGHVLHGAWRLATRTAAIAPLALVSHHFMSRKEIETPLGRDRLKHCVFCVPVNGEVISMCEVNARGIREEYYASLSDVRTEGVGVGSR